MKEKLLKMGKYQKLILIVIVIALVPIILLMQQDSGEVEALKIKNVELEKNLSDSDARLTKSRSEYASVFADYKDIRVEYDKMKEDSDYNEYITKKNDVELKLSEKEIYLESVNAEILVSQEKLDNIIGETLEKKAEPISLPAGYLYAGIDFPIDRYRIFDGSSNFVVYDSKDSLMVNIILGNGKHNVSEYIYSFRTGDCIRCNSSFKIELIE